MLQDLASAQTVHTALHTPQASAQTCSHGLCLRTQHHVASPHAASPRHVASPHVTVQVLSSQSDGVGMLLGR